ncbi:MAG TPA: aminopeptidase [Gemmatimonadaceae bacterium]|nr:aminopeptidase [Gemmatimonadaceae bacterium]
MTGNKRVKWVRLVGRSVAVLLLLVVAYLAIAPTGHYLLRAAWEEGKILARRRPIPELAAASTTPPALRAKLELVLAARAFAHDSLGLETGESFTTYSPLDRDTLVLVLSGAYRDRLKAYTWWFPVVGRVPYKGYFDFDQARAAEHDLTARGYDARLGAASAFSTLGWFNDPLLPTTLRADSLTVANTVIHELTHNTYYAPGGAVFNESFANFVGARGAERFFASRGHSAAAQEVAARWQDEKIMGRFWAALYARVAAAFAARPGDEPAQVASRIAARDSLYAEAREEIVHELVPQLRTMSPRAAERIRLDNAVLMARRVYLTDLDVFDAVLAKNGGDLRRAVAAIIVAARSDSKHPFDAVRRSVGLPVTEPAADTART